MKRLISPTERIKPMPSIVLARILKDDALRIPLVSDESPISRATISAKGEALFRYTSQWTLNLSDPKELRRKIEELQWMNTIIYAGSGSRPGKRFHADFFLCVLTPHWHEGNSG